MNDEELFAVLDLDGDGCLSRDELHRAASAFGWHWQQAPFFALMDYLTLCGPLAREEFVSCMSLIGEDPHGVYGRVLDGWAEKIMPLVTPLPKEVEEVCAAQQATDGKGGADPGGMVALLDEIVGDREACDYAALLETKEIGRLSVATEEGALLLVDPQRSFTEGAWMDSLGPIGYMEVMPISQAFDNCARLLRCLPRPLAVMFTRCPFPPDSYGWDARFDGILNDAQPYFIKPGNNVLSPPGNGFRLWVEGLLEQGRKRLVLGGCTLNSCVRVSAIEIQKHFRDRELEGVIDLNLCGARAGNYLKAEQFGGKSAVAAAVEEMFAHGVRVANGVEWL
ncbi:MAG: hypothetical protein P8X63_15465 [Desulfuromonadaceae bacterium]